MPALPADIARYTNDGIQLSHEDASIAAAHPDAVDLGDDTLEMFFYSASDAEIVLAERFGILSQANPPHEGLVVEESLGLGSTIEITGTVPCFRFISSIQSIDQLMRTRAYAYEAGSDQYSIELIA